VELTEPQHAHRVPIDVRILDAQDASVLELVAPDVFDGPVDPRWSGEFLADARHHLAVALDGQTVIGMASAVHYVHPDKAPQLWINEVGVAPTYQHRGVGRQLLDVLLAHGRALGCTEAWVLTEPANGVAQRLYARAGGVLTPGGTLLYSFPLDGGADR
jgi:ribosomal protein S18 acetylase RimI-like enzyme